MNINTSGFDLTGVFDAPDAAEPQAKPKSRAKAKATAQEKVDDALDAMCEIPKQSKKAAAAEAKIKKAADQLEAKKSRDTASQEERELHFEKLKLLQKIARYTKSERFASHLKENGLSHTPAALQKKSLEDLERIIQEIEICISNKNAGKFWKENITHGMQFTESTVTNLLGFNVNGTTQALMQDDEFCDVLEEIQLKNSDYVYINPYLRASYKVIGTAMYVNAMHKATEMMDTDQVAQLHERAREALARRMESQVGDEAVMDPPQIEEREDNLETREPVREPVKPPASDADDSDADDSDVTNKPKAMPKKAVAKKEPVKRTVVRARTTIISADNNQDMQTIAANHKVR